MHAYTVIEDMTPVMLAALVAGACSSWIGPIALVDWRANLLSSRACSLEV